MKELRIIEWHNLRILVDDADYEALPKTLWFLSPNGRPHMFTDQGKRVYLHRMLLPKSHNIDGNLLDCRRSNLALRPSKPKPQKPPKARTKKNMNASSQYLGVTYNKKQDEYRCHIQYDGKRHFLGSFVKEIDAARTYDQIARTFSPIPKLNFPS